MKIIPWDYHRIKEIEDIIFGTNIPSYEPLCNICFETKPEKWLVCQGPAIYICGSDICYNLAIMQFMV